ncbi:phosphotransferase family protein [Streptomyces sp. NBC_00005]|uniref:phosphotransferase family protein n=1 Tax=Streptomyces sp. NBC_00005 TaxID=2903609 RepID=UPI00324308FD
MTDATGTRTAEPPGLDLAALRAHLESALPGTTCGELTGSVIAGGKSNLTYDVSDGSRHWVVRRPPLGHVLATAHDMSREHRVMTALHGSQVPVPRTYLLCESPDVIGAPFYVMERVEGTTFRWRSQLEPLGAGRIEAISRRLVSTLASLHTVDPTGVGLGDFGRPDGYLERQVRRWGRQLDASRSRDLAGVDELRRLLESTVPPSGEAALVHGDFRLDNTLVNDQDNIVALLDWEMATLGDPLADLALMLAYDRLARHPEGDGIADASTAAGYLGASEVVDLYAGLSGRDVSRIGFHLGLAFFKLAVILEGIHFRFISGRTVGDGFNRAGALVEPALAAGLESLKE